MGKEEVETIKEAMKEAGWYTLGDDRQGGLGTVLTFTNDEHSIVLEVY